MARVLRNKNQATKFQILIEIAANQPNIQQKDIAQRVGVTSQAVSDYISGLVRDGWVASDGRSRYWVTKEGVSWVLETFRELRGYSAYVERAVTNITVCAAVAGEDLSQDQAVGLEMRDGLLFATGAVGKGARGIAIADARGGEEVGVSDIEGLVELVTGKVTILKVPDIVSGGSGSVDLAELRKYLGQRGPLGAVGIESLIALRRIGFEPQYFYGVTEAAIEAAESGLPFTIVCAEGEISRSIGRLCEENIDYELIALGRGEEGST